jgi:hypothetical protein
VHGIYPEPGSARLWCLTGDVGRECRIAVTDDDFRSLTTVGCGDESWRAVSLAFLGGTVVYGTDAEFRQNHFYTIDPASGRRERLAPVDGPVYFNSSLAEGALFSVTAEGCPSQAVNQASLWWVSPVGGIHRLCSYPKDRWHRALMFGMILFALGPGLGSGPSRAIGRLHALAQTRGRSIEVTLESNRG